MILRRLAVSVSCLFVCVACSKAPEQVFVTGALRGATSGPNANVAVTATYMDDRGQLQVMRDTTDSAGAFRLALPPKRFARFFAKTGEFTLADHEFVTPPEGELTLLGSGENTVMRIMARDSASTWGRAFNVLRDNWEERSREVMLIPSVAGAEVTGDSTDDVRVLAEWRQASDSLLRQVYAARVLQTGVAHPTSREVATMLAEIDSTDALYRMVPLATIRTKAKTAAAKPAGAR